MFQTAEVSMIQSKIVMLEIPPFIYHSVHLIVSFSSLFFSYEVVLALKKDQVDGPLYYYVFNTLLYFLLVLHIYWWVLMLRMLIKQIQAKGKISEDIRSGKLKYALHLWLSKMNFLCFT